MLTDIRILITGFLYLLTSASSKIISTPLGNITGKAIVVDNQPLDVYIGIRYGIAPVGELRFKPPVAVKPWNGVYNATQNPPSCMQTSCFQNCSEDCLFLNIWVPKSDSINKSDSVMVWIHGGAFTFGSINDVDGSIFSTYGRVILVAINYRLGPFGYFYSGTDDARGNMGMKDQVLALRWVKDNIKAFGGDPAKITIFGQSAGAMSVSALLVSPLTRNLFKYAIMQSGSTYHPSMIVRSPSLIKSRSTKLAITLGCANQDQDIGNDPKVMSCMREKSTSSILLAERAIMTSFLLGPDNPWLAIFTLMYGDDCLPIPPYQEFLAGNIHAKSFMIGTVTDEGSAFMKLFVPSLLLEFFDSPITTKPQAASYITTMSRGLKDPPPPKDIVNYYLANVSNLNSSLLLKRAHDSMGDCAFVCPSVFQSESSSAYGKSVYYYIFSHRWSRSPNRKWMGVVHSEEIRFVFGLPLKDKSMYTSDEKEFSKELIGAWTSFAKNGKPNYSKLSEEWPLYTNNSRKAVELNPNIVSYKNPFKDACYFWKKYF